jgi:ACS family glucarate transporter-like MFS transporter
VDTLSSAPAATRARYGVLGFTLVLTAIAYLDRVCIATAAPEMKAELGLSDVQLGYVFSAFTFAYAVFEVPSGWLADRFGARLMLTRIVAWWSVMTAATGWVGGFGSLFAVRFLFGVGEAGTFPSIARVFGAWLPASERGRAFGLALMTAALGGALTQPLVATLLDVMPWRYTFPIFGLLGVLWAVAWFWWFRDDPQRHPRANAAELALIGRPPQIAHPAVPWRALVTNRTMAALCLMYLGAIYGWYFYITWLPTYLLRERGFTLEQVGWLAALPLLGIAGGVLGGGWASDGLARRWGLRTGRCLPGVIGLPLAALAVWHASWTVSPLGAALALSVAAGLAALGVSPAWAVCLEIGGRHAGVVSGAMNTFGNLGGALSPVVIGLCLERWHSWQVSLATLAVGYVLTTLCWLLVDPRQAIVGAA